MTINLLLYEILNHYREKGSFHQRLLFLLLTNVKLKVYLQVNHGKIECMCLQRKKRCGRACEKDSVTYDQYKGIEELIKNKTKLS